MIIKDVAIIGSGVSGSSTAFHLAKAGRNVVILERDDKCHKRTCSGGMAASVQNWLPFKLKPVVEEVINKVEFTWQLEDNVIAELPGSSPFWIVNRVKLDELIINHAISNGAEIIKPFFVKNIIRKDNLWELISNDQQKIIAKSIVIADGTNSNWAQTFGLGPKSLHRARTISLRVEGRGNIQRGATRFEFGLVKYGFAWAFPANDSINIGIGTFIGRNSTCNKEVLNKFLRSLGINSEIEPIEEKFLNVWNGHPRLHKNGIVVVGDAASLSDPFLAEGIRPALISGFYAAHHLNNWILDETTDLKEYTQTMKIMWGNSMAWGQKIAQVFYRFPKLGYQLGIKRPTAPKRIAQILSGDLSYGDIAQRSIRRLLFNSK